MRLALMANSALNKLILANVLSGGVVLIGYLAMRAQYGADVRSAHWEQVNTWIGMPLPARTFLLHFYGLFTHIFVPANFYSFIVQLSAIWTFGRIFTEFMGGKRLLPVYLYSGITGGIVTLISYQFLQYTGAFQHGYLVGPAASVTGVMAAVAFLYPNLPLNLFVMGTVRLKYVALVYFMISLAVLATQSNFAAYFASLGGFIFGVSYAFLYKNGFDMAGGFIRLVDMLRGSDRRARMKVKYGRPLTDDEYNTLRQEREATLDELLDKINDKGMKSLSRREKQLLDKYSKE